MLPLRALVTRAVVPPALALLAVGAGLCAWRAASARPSSHPDATAAAARGASPGASPGANGLVPPSRRWRLDPHALLIEDGMTMPVAVEAAPTAEGVAVEIRGVPTLSQGAGRPIDREAYVFSRDGLALAEGADERYCPPIPLVARAAAWSWKGTLDGHGPPVPAEARVVSRTVSFRVGGAPLPAVESVVTLVFGEGATAGRTLRTVYVPGRGVVHREFGSSVRTTAADPEAPSP